MNSCGICGGGVRLFTGELHGRPITDWKHTWVPDGTAPHRPVLGTPVDEQTLERLKSLTEFIKQRDERCATCGRSSLTHPEEEV